MNGLVNNLRQAFKDKDYRHGYVDEFLNVNIATQIKVLREQRGWSQKELADRAEMKQPRISIMENVNYSSWSIKILRKLAEAFDLTLCVYFESFGTRISDIAKFSRTNLERYSFKDDPYFKETSEEELVLQGAVAKFMESPKQQTSCEVLDIELLRRAKNPIEDAINPEGVPVIKRTESEKEDKPNITFNDLIRGATA